MAESFGARLRQQRERQHIALAAIAAQTKISLSLLEGLERDDVSHWPAGIFRRSFIRSYAQIIQLDADAVVREFLELYPDPPEPTAAELLDPKGEVAGQRPPTRLSCLLASTIRHLRPPVVQESSPVPVNTDGIRAVGDPQSVKAESQPEPQPEPQSEAQFEPQSEPQPALSAVAGLCTDLGLVLEIREIAPLLERAARALNAVGLIIWLWDPQEAALQPALASGYPDEVIARLPRVRRDTDNATAASFRSGQTHIVNGSDQASGAVVVPLLTPLGCGGVLAVELRQGGEQRETVRALATIFAAQLATLVGSMPLAQAANA
jgi:transcriptional regulator with XRE-family HTH domain